MSCILKLLTYIIVQNDVQFDELRLIDMLARL